MKDFFLVLERTCVVKPNETTFLLHLNIDGNFMCSGNIGASILRLNFSRINVPFFLFLFSFYSFSQRCILIYFLNTDYYYILFLIEKTCKIVNAHITYHILISSIKFLNFNNINSCFR